MLLAVDAGNTNTVFAVFEGGGDGDEAPRGRWRAMTDATADERRVRRLAGAAPGAVRSQPRRCRRGDRLQRGAARGSVRSSLSAPIIAAATARVIGEPGVVLGIDVNVPRTRTRWGPTDWSTRSAPISAVAGALIVLDFGTATTFDSVSSEGAYEGGIIAPGIGLSLEALHQAAAQLPLIAVKRPEKVIAQATVPAMQSGIYWGYVGLIEGIVARMKDEIGVARDDRRDRRAGGPLRRGYACHRHGRSRT